MKKIKINDKEFEVIKDYKDAIEIEKIEEYIKKYCAYECKYFILKKCI